MRCFQPPQEYAENAATIFLAGSVSDAENWQRKFAQLLPPLELAVLNPRWDNFPHGDANAESRQIEWEHRHLARAGLVVFWFSRESLCPITLFELGACCGAGAAMVVGCDPEYPRRSDIHIHLQLRRPEISIAPTLEALALQVTEYFRKHTELAASP